MPESSERKLAALCFFPNFPLTNPPTDNTQTRHSGDEKCPGTNSLFFARPWVFENKGL
jgi:hypothetical protein